MIDPNESFLKSCPSGNTLIDSDVDLNRNPENYVESERDREEFNEED